MPSALDLQNRWTNDLLETLTQSIRRSKKDGYKNKPLPPSPFGMVPESGLVDFRGFYFTSQVVAITAEHIDFSYSAADRDWPIEFHQCDISNSLFQGMQYLGNLGGRFDKCDFSKSHGVKCRFSGEFNDCQFENCRFPGTSFHAIFRHCSFESANLRNASWPACIFEECSFKGSFLGLHPLECVDPQIVTYETSSFRIPKTLIKP